MCGIAGIFSAPDQAPVPLEELRRMIAMLGHRGPDGYGIYRDDRVGFAHARLSIIDLAGGFQPLANEDRTIWLCFNGEIFNYVELRRQLASQGHRFATDGDSEVIVHCYEQYGTEAWSMLNGQFAFALWDRPRGQLWLVRDRLGILPLHFAVTDGGVVFASEVKAILAGGRVDTEIDRVGLAQTFTRWSVAAPDTLFSGVRAVRPGTALCFDRALGETEHRYWSPDLTEDHAWARRSVDDVADELGARLDEAVRLRLRADVPVGAYLSGGLDSSVIGALVRSADESPLQTFAVRFADPAFDETEEQRRMAALLGTEHHELLCGSSEIQAAIPDVVWHCESPLLRTAPAPLFLLSGLVRDAGMKVVLTGEGADELLAGYSIFKEAQVRRFWARDPASKMRPSLLARLHPEVHGAATARQSELWQAFFGRGLTETDDPSYSHRIRWQNTGWSRRLLAPEVRAATPLDVESIEHDSLPARWTSWTPLARAQWLEIESFMSPYLLSCQGDRVAMAHGVEVRYPFLDPNVVDFCLGLPSRFKLVGLRDKVALRRLGSRFLPTEIWQRPKQPYRAPMTSTLFGESRPPYVDELVSDASVARIGLIDPKAVGHLVRKARRTGGHMSGEREEMALVGVVTLQLLGQMFIEDFPSLAAERRQRLDSASLCVLEDFVAEEAPDGSKGRASEPSAVEQGGVR